MKCIQLSLLILIQDCYLNLTRIFFRFIILLFDSTDSFGNHLQRVHLILGDNFLTRCFWNFPDIIQLIPYRYKLWRDDFDRNIPFGIPDGSEIRHLNFIDHRMISWTRFIYELEFPIAQIKIMLAIPLLLGSKSIINIRAHVDRSEISWEDTSENPCLKFGSLNVDLEHFMSSKCPSLHYIK